jgi:hypothetical protein
MKLIKKNKDGHDERACALSNVAADQFRAGRAKRGRLLQRYNDPKSKKYVVKIVQATRRAFSLANTAPWAVAVILPAQ